MSELQIIKCGLPKDHECDSNGPFIMIHENGERMLESKARRLSEIGRLGKGWNTGSATCSVCGMSDYENSFWREV